MPRKAQTGITFEEDSPPPSRSREVIARHYVAKVLASAAPEAINFQRQVLNDPDVDMNLRVKVSDSLLDRFMGKAAQEVRIGESMDRPIVFSSSLSAMREGARHATDAHVVAANSIEAYVDGVISTLVDQEGVTI